MSFQQAYNKSASRDIEFTPAEEQTEVLLKQEEFKKWMAHPFTREVLLFLGKRELELLNNARSAIKVDLKHENISRNLLKSIAYREIIEYLTENKLPTKE